ncbi:hypothetical protein TWF569_004981 [Orbilia oligospora]|uniref:Uncharacterized protein n=1 Tax=Orbilia oligospora TaxID=2813651 RepID=A0A7C8N9M5_ORBOL|nr:hypothetical protein TWF706_009924 [Orbilia oligospora]KAF3099139.1 hypothetical protein TWF103_008904 [Orbilia oligospora]KAF3101907.1 hypothetical protein TWF102_004648 [Orbilia oligospora]KAF3126731.1 hypothetical protein TWF594_000864 [Orbilia oligospora]KAF3146666.1 hypothetical protein TWF703_003937 [Orbilia oligospora]
MAMFVLPPPPRYPPTGFSLGSPYAMGGAPMPVIETSNSIAHPTGPEYTFHTGEGQYTLREDIHLATPPPHPSETPIVSPNPLAIQPAPPSAGTKFSTIVIKSVPGTDRTSQLYRNSVLAQNGELEGEHASEPRTSISTEEDSTDGGSKSGTDTAGASTVATSMVHLMADKFGGENASLAHAPTKDNKRKKPKNNIQKSNSSFVSRVIMHEALTKKLQETGASEDLFVFANINRAYHWLNLSAKQNKQESLSKVLFTKSHPICHDVNHLTKGATHIDIVMGFTTGDIVWFEPMSNKYSRLNKNGAINSSAVLDIQWIPGSENLFLAGHADGSLIVYDKEKEDAPFVAEEFLEEGEASRKPISGFVTAKSVNSKIQKFNPVAYWSVAQQAINAFAFSPDHKHLAVVSEDGRLCIINILKEQLLDVFNSYYGGLLCVCWSPDGRYILTGGQDDLISIWSFADRRIVARCSGHHSWVTSVSFDPWRCDARTYRFGSVGEDGRLLLWDFSVGMLSRPKATSKQSRGSISSVPLNGTGRRADGHPAGRLRSESVVSKVDDDGVVHHPVEPRARTSNLPAIMSKVVDVDPLCQLEFREDCIITTCREGHVKTWDRPKSNLSVVPEGQMA